jgi:DNA-binding transcriptional LysR family regulator
MGDGIEPLSIRQLEVFVTLVDEGSFTQAASKLGLSQSTVSGHVADLERRLGVRVVERSRSGVRTTAAGRALLAPARQALSAERAARMAVEELTGLLRGRLVVGGSTIPAAYLVPPLLAEFHARHPEIRLQLSTGDSREVIERVQTAHVDVGIVGADPEPFGLDGVEVGEDRLVLVLPPRHPLAARPSLTVAEVVSQPLVLREEGSGTREATLRSLEAAGGPGNASQLNVVCEVGSTETMKSFVRSGLGLAFVSALAVEEEIRTGSLVSVPVRSFQMRRVFHLASRKGDVLGPAARAFRDLALERRLRH